MGNAEATRFSERRGVSVVVGSMERLLETCSADALMIYASVPLGDARSPSSRGGMGATVERSRGARERLVNAECLMVYAFRAGAYPADVHRPFSVDVIEPAGFDFRKIRVANFTETMAPDAGPVVYPYSSGFRVSTDYLPKKVRFGDPEWLMDFESDGALSYVSARARKLIEQFEPGIHQFEPVEFVNLKGEHVADMFVMFVCRRIDSVDRGHTNYLLSPHIWMPAESVARIKPELVPSGTDLKAPPRLVLNKAQIGDAHLWRDKRIVGDQFMSDQLINAIDAAGLTGLGRLVQESV